MAIPFIVDKKYITFDEKPVFTADYNAQLDPEQTDYKLAIVMQGPLKLEEHFTYESLKLYKKTFSKSLIILSTWKTENKEELEKIKALGVIVVLNDIPPIKGLWNINYQIVSTQNGLKTAKSKGAEYVIKTRTDQRMYETNISDFLFNILKIFPVFDKTKQKSRLVSLSENTFKYRLYDVSDMFLFGHIDDVIKFWSCALETRTKLPAWKNLLDFCKRRPSEIYFTSEYLTKIGHNCTYTLQDSWLCYSRYFCIIDHTSIGMFWPKYSNFTNRWRNFLGISPELESLTFKEWLNLYIGLKDKTNIPEHFLTDGWKTHNAFPVETSFIRKSSRWECIYKKEKIDNRRKITLFSCLCFTYKHKR